MIKISSFQKLLSLFLLFIIVLLLCRKMYSGHFTYLFLLWNLFLAWIPFQLSLLFKKINGQSKWVQVGLGAIWLLFFPNALYIVTDLIHLDGTYEVPVWFDSILILTSSLTGLMLAFVSLHNVQVFLKQKMNNLWVNNFVLLSLFAGSFGVYVGRFLRRNSWDVLTNPFTLLKEIAACFFYPVQNYKSWAITVLFTCFFGLLYFAIKKLPGYLKEPGNEF